MTVYLTFCKSTPSKFNLMACFSSLSGTSFGTHTLHQTKKSIFKNVVPKTYVPGLFVHDIQSRTFCPGLFIQDFLPRTFCPGLFAQDFLPRTFCPRLFVKDFLSKTFCQGLFAQKILSFWLFVVLLLVTGHFAPGNFVLRHLPQIFFWSTNLLTLQGIKSFVYSFGCHSCK